MTAQPPQPQQSKHSAWAAALPWLRLMRLPTVFTAMADILCGYLVSQDVLAADLWAHRSLWLLLVASGGLYLSGMVFNDVFDAALDARERPERPIPSGRISRRSASILGTILMATGLVAAWSVDHASLRVAIAIAVGVLLYDAVLKSTLAGPLIMGGCRGLNILLGASAAADPFATISSPQTIAAIGLATYIVGVTVFARNEAGNSSMRSMAFGLAIAVSGIAVDAWLFLQPGIPAAARLSAWTMLGLLAANVVFRGVRTMRTPESRLIQKTVGLMLLCIIFLDAAVVFGVTADPRLAAVVAALVVPGMLLKRVIPLS